MREHAGHAEASGAEEGSRERGVASRRAGPGPGIGAGSLHLAVREPPRHAGHAAVRESGEIDRRLAVYREFLASELSYIRDLSTLHDVYETPFLHALERKSGLLDRAEIRTVFCNYSEIQQIHQAFYDAVKAKIHDVRLSQLLSREFLRTANQFHLYSKYFAAYERAQHLLSRLFRERSGLEDYVFLLSRDPRAQGLDLFSFLIKPIQVCDVFCLFFL